jgi:hypothetical protein
MRYLACLLILSTAAAFAAVAGVKVTNVNVADNNVTVIITNTTQHIVTAWALEIIGTRADGKPIQWQDGQEYGPPSLGDRNLKPGEHTAYVDSVPKGVTGLKAHVVLAIYDDQTAEVADERAFEAVIAKRAAIGKAFSVSAQIFKDASLDQAPRKRAERDLDSAIGSAKTTKTEVQFLKTDKAMLDRAPKDATAATFMLEQAQYRQAHAAAWNADFANVRRLN